MSGPIPLFADVESAAVPPPRAPASRLRVGGADRRPVRRARAFVVTTSPRDRDRRSPRDAGPHVGALTREGSPTVPCNLHARGRVGSWRPRAPGRRTAQPETGDSRFRAPTSANAFELSRGTTDVSCRVTDVATSDRVVGAGPKVYERSPVSQPQRPRPPGAHPSSRVRWLVSSGALAAASPGISAPSRRGRGSPPSASLSCLRCDGITSRPRPPLSARRRASRRHCVSGSQLVLTHYFSPCALAVSSIHF